MANLEIQIGSDNSELLKGIRDAEKEIRDLERQQEILIRANLDTSGLDRRITEARTNLDRLRGSLNSVGQATQSFSRNTVNGSNALTQFGRIAQDAPFGIMGIGNNITATAEAFGALSQQAGGAGGALRAVGASLAGPGGILLAVSLVTTALTIMSQKGITVSDVFNKLTGNFDEFKQELKEVNKEAAKNAAEQVQSVKSYVSAAKDINLSMQERLIAVKKLQDEYPAFFGNLTKEQILNGNVSTAVKEVTAAILAKAKAQAYSAKLGELAAKEVELREKESKSIAQVNKYVKEYNKILEKSKVPAGSFDSELANAAVPIKALKDRLADLQKEIRQVNAAMQDIAVKSTVEVKAAIKLDFDPEKVKAPKKVKVKKEHIKKIAMTEAMILADERKRALDLIQPEEIPLPFIIPAVDEKFKELLESTKRFNEDLRSIIESGFANTFGSLGESIGTALSEGGNVFKAIGASLVNSMGGVLSAIGDKLIALGAASLATAAVMATFGSPVGIPPALAAIAAGLALKVGGSFLSGESKGMTGSGRMGDVSAGNSVRNPTSSISTYSSSSGLQNVVFEISGNSLIGVIRNSMSKNAKLGGTITI